ncbi:MAG: peptidoglycan-binding domain-containing protein [Candidatus Omnitrophota bacterium]
MAKRMFAVLVVAMFSLSVLGCASTRKNNDLEIQSLRNQVTVLEAQLQNKDEEINGLRDTLSKQEAITAPAQEKVTSCKRSKRKVIGEAKNRPTIKEIQIALSNAGYDPGSTDGKMGKQTKNAIKAFQAANNLPADGHVGTKTWELLKDNLYTKVK